jgi:hypothetical protein
VRKNAYAVDVVITVPNVEASVVLELDNVEAIKKMV